MIFFQYPSAQKNRNQFFPLQENGYFFASFKNKVAKQEQRDIFQAYKLRCCRIYIYMMIHKGSNGGVGGVNLGKAEEKYQRKIRNLDSYDF